MNSNNLYDGKKAINISLDQYRDMVRNFWRKFKKNLITDANNDEVYFVYNEFHPGLEGHYDQCLYYGVFSKIKNINSMISKANDNNETILENTETDSAMYHWVIEKHRIINGDYEKIFSAKFYDLNTFFDVSFFSLFSEFVTKEEQEIFEEYEALSGSPFSEKYNIVFPYKRGDIIMIDSPPLSKEPRYFIYYSNGNALEVVGDSLRFKHLLSNYSYSGLPCFYLYFANYITSACDKKINLLANLIKDAEKDEYTDDLLEWD